MSTVLVTGGGGFIGSNLAEYLLSQGYTVRVLDNFSTGRPENLRKIKNDIDIVKGDIRDLKTVRKTVKDVECVFHQAALASVAESIKDPLLTNEVNTTGTMNVLIAATDSSVKKIVYASSSAVYGDVLNLPLKEDMKPSPLSPYAVSKLAGEQYCKAFNEIYGLETVSLRYFNVYGPKQNPSSEYAAVIPKFIAALQNKRRPTIYGDGEQSRDFAFVKDVIRANILAMDRGRSGEVFNIGSGKMVTINSLTRAIGEFLGYTVPKHVDPKPGDIRHSLADISKAKKILGYRPKYNLKEGLGETIEWYKYAVESKKGTTQRNPNRKSKNGLLKTIKTGDC